MRIEQIKYVKEIYDTGSISSAAKRLYLSQSNLSTAIKSLENELGFEILKRTTNGVTFTPQGPMFVREAKDIMAGLESIYNINKVEEPTSSLRLIGDDCTPVDDAFLSICNKYANHNIRASLIHATQSSTIESIEKDHADIGFVISANINSLNQKNELENKGLKWTKLCETIFNINVSRNHPAIVDDKLDIRKLKDYPIVLYNFSGKKETGYGDTPYLSFVNTEKVIKVPSKELRCNIVSESTAYSAGITLPKKCLDALNWKSFPVENFKVHLGLITRKNYRFTEIEKDFISALKENIKYLEIK